MRAGCATLLNFQGSCIWTLLTFVFLLFSCTRYLASERGCECIWIHPNKAQWSLMIGVEVHPFHVFDVKDARLELSVVLYVMCDSRPLSTICVPVDLFRQLSWE